ncbi:MAG: hypothetical protein ABIL45_04150 [candidate division WOR-3 bacterium]
MKKRLIGEIFEGERGGCFWTHYKLFEVETPTGKYYELWRAWNGLGNPKPNGEIRARKSTFDLWWIFLFKGNIDEDVIDEQLHRFKDVNKIPEEYDYEYTYNIVTTLEYKDYLLIHEEIHKGYDTEYRYYKMKIK